MNEIAGQLAEHFEGYRPGPYYCPAGILTGGFGHAWKPGEKIHPLPPAEARNILSKDLSRAENAAFRLCPGLLVESEARQGAVIDFVFNLGAGRLRASTLRRRLNQRNWPEVRRELKKWIHGGGRVLPGLVLRRAAEAKLI